LLAFLWIADAVAPFKHCAAFRDLWEIFVNLTPLEKAGIVVSVVVVARTLGDMFVDAWGQLRPLRRKKGRMGDRARRLSRTSKVNHKHVQRLRS
jgi:hypothetical protein